MMRSALVMLGWTVGGVFVLGALCGVAMTLVGRAVVRWWGGRLQDTYVDWARSVIRALLAGRPTETKVQILSTAYEDATGAPCDHRPQGPPPPSVVSSYN